MLYTHLIWMSFIWVFFLPISPHTHTTLGLGFLLSTTSTTAAAATTTATATCWIRSGTVTITTIVTWWATVIATTSATQEKKNSAALKIKLNLPSSATHRSTATWLLLGHVVVISTTAVTSVVLWRNTIGTWIIEWCCCWWNAIIASSTSRWWWW